MRPYGEDFLKYLLTDPNIMLGIAINDQRNWVVNFALKLFTIKKIKHLRKQSRIHIISEEEYLNKDKLNLDKLEQKFE